MWVNTRRSRLKPSNNLINLVTKCNVTIVSLVRTWPKNVWTLTSGASAGASHQATPVCDVGYHVVQCRTNTMMSLWHLLILQTANYLFIHLDTVRCDWIYRTTMYFFWIATECINIKGPFTRASTFASRWQHCVNEDVASNAKNGCRTHSLHLMQHPHQHVAIWCKCTCRRKCWRSCEWTLTSKKLEGITLF